MWMPGVRRACDRYIEPNLPAPISTTRTGRASRGALFEEAVEVHEAVG